MELPEGQFFKCFAEPQFPTRPVRSMIPPIIPRRIALTESFLGAASIEGNQGELDGADF
jgi:hypothetical protein